MKGKRVLKKQSNRNGLLSTYFASLFSVMLCFVMLLGTTFAWFYTNNTSLGNEIHSGILEVDMLHNDISLAEQPGHSVFSSGNLWTPDRNTQTETVEVFNTGNVMLDYKLDFVPVPDKENTESVANLFTVYVDGKEVGTLDEFLNDMADKQDDICLTVCQGQEAGLEPGKSHFIQIEMQMDTTRASGFMGQRVPVYLKLEAYQHLAGPSE